MTCKIAIVGEAWGEHEERQRQPFVGPSGYELTRMLAEAGIHRADCFLTNVFNLRPTPSNDVENLCGTKDNSSRALPPLKSGKYVQNKYLPELTRLYGELSVLRPNIIIALGNTAAWATLLNSGISKIRGTVTDARAPAIRGIKVLPTYHPAAILREWSLRAVTVLDLQKAARESAFPEIRRPQRTVYIEPNLEDLEKFYAEHVLTSARLSIDIETAGSQITCFGVATSASVAIVVPFVDQRKPGSNYWGTAEAECEAWNFVRKTCAISKPKVFQNGLYDIHFLWRGYGIAIGGSIDDTMLMHHALQPESEKGLAFLGSVYTNESSWKLMRQRGKTTIKRDD